MLLLDQGKAMELARQRLEAAEEARKVPSGVGELESRWVLKSVI